MKFSPRVVSTLLLLATTPPVLGSSSSNKNLLLRSRDLLDGEAPVLTCEQTVALDLTGTTVNLMIDDVKISATDNVGIETEDFTAESQTTYDCTDIGAPETVTLEVADAANNMASCVATVTAQDAGDPTAVCQDITVELQASGGVSITPSDIDNGSSDNCDTSLDLSLDTTTFGCGDVGSNSVTLTVTDDASNSVTCMADVTVEDNIAPTIACSSSTVTLTGATPSGTLNFLSAVTTDDACGNPSIDPMMQSFGCSDVGLNTVSVTATDNNGNTASCDVMVTVGEDEDPVAMCAAGPITKVLNTATASLSVGEVNDGSTDNCAIANIALSQDSFTCADVGSNSITMTVTDTSGNTDTCDVTVNVEDDTPPDVDCVDVTLAVDGSGMLTVTVADLLANNDPPDDNCGIPTASVSQESFSCADIGMMPPTQVTVTAVDASMNSDACTSQVIVIDDTPPTITGCDDQVVTLGSSGMGGLDTAAFTADDNCDSSLVKTISEVDFSCADIGSNTVTVTFIDDSGNEETCDPDITVQDTTDPTITCPTTISITASGPGILTVPLSGVAATDNCSAAVSTPDLMYDCDNAELSRSIIVTAVDPSGNTDTCAIDVTIVASAALDCSDGGSFFETLIEILSCGLV